MGDSQHASLEPQLTRADSHHIQPDLQHVSTDEKPARVRPLKGRRLSARIMEWLALRELHAENRERYAAENARERAYIASLRAQRNAAIDALDEQLRQCAVAREMKSTERAAAWVDANAKAAAVHAQTKAEVKQATQELRAKEQQKRAALREERNQEQDAWGLHRREQWARRETQSAERRAEWVNANADAVELGRDARRKRKVQLARIRKEHDARRAAMRQERNQGQDRRDEQRWEMAEAQAAETAKIAQVWADARGVASQEHREMLAQQRFMQKARAEALDAWRAWDTQARKDRNEMVDRLSAEVDKATRAQAVALAEARDAARNGDATREQAQRELADQMRTRADSLRTELRKRRNQADEERAQKRQAFLEQQNVELALTRDAYRAAVQESNARRREAKLASAPVQAKAALVRRELEDSLRQERNQEMDRRGQEYRDLNTTRELSLAEVNEDYIEARAHARKVDQKVRGIDGPARAEDLQAERREADEHRRLRNASSEARSRAGRELDTLREQTLIDIRQPYLKARQEERAAWQQFKKVNDPLYRADLARERELEAQVRQKRNALLDDFARTVREIDQKRELARCADREQARQVAHEVYEKLMNDVRAASKRSAVSESSADGE